MRKKLYVNGLGTLKSRLVRSLGSMPHWITVDLIEDADCVITDEPLNRNTPTLVVGNNRCQENDICEYMSEVDIDNPQILRIKLEIAIRRHKEFVHKEFIHHKIEGIKSDLMYFENAVNELYIVYQPIVRASSKSVFGYEALMRSSFDGFKGPGHLAELANRLELSRELGRIVRSKAPILFLESRVNGFLFINMFASELFDPLLTEDKSPINRMSSRVVLEITEREAIDNSEEFKDKLKELKKLSYKIAVDDLGSGYSGLASILEVNPDVIKLEMLFSQRIQHSSLKQNLVASMVKFCNDTGKEIIAEGVETQEEFDILREIGVDLFQGYLLARPGTLTQEINWKAIH